MSGRPATLRDSDPQPLALGAVAAVGALALLAALYSVVPDLYLNPDIASAPVIGTLMAHAPAGSLVTLGNYPWYEPLWLMEATRSLPAHRQIWEAIPIVGFVLAIALVLWAARRALGNWAALVTGAILLSTSAATRFVLLTPSAHWPNVLHVAVLVAVLVYLNGRRARVSTGWFVAGGVALALFTAAGATDTLFLVDGLLPFVVTALLGWWRTRHPVQRRIAFFSLAVGLGALVGGLLLRALMRNHEHVVQTPYFHPGFIAAGGVGRNIETLLESFVSLGGGNFFGSAFHALSVLAFAAAVLTFVAGVRVVLGCWRAAPSLGRPAARVTPSGAAREAWLVFWGTTILVTCVAFVVTNLPEDLSSSRYLMTVYFGVAALLPALVRSQRARGVVTAGIVAFALISVITLASLGRSSYGTSLANSDVSALTSYAKRSGLAVGYSDYATAPVLTYAAGLKVDVFPVAPCGSTLCPFYLNTISSWYAPRSGVQSFLIVDAASRGSYLAVTKAPAALGTPTSIKQFGDLTVYVYDHDIASAFGA